MAGFNELTNQVNNAKNDVNAVYSAMREIIDNKDLEHQRNAPNDPDDYLGYRFDRLDPAHGAKGDRQTKGRAAQQRHHKNQQRYPKAIQQKQSYF